MNPIRIVDTSSPGSITAAGGRPPPQAQQFVHMLGNIHSTSALAPVSAEVTREIEKGANVEFAVLEFAPALGGESAAYLDNDTLELCSTLQHAQPFAPRRSPSCSFAPLATSASICRRAPLPPSNLR